MSRIAKALAWGGSIAVACGVLVYGCLAYSQLRRSELYLKQVESHYTRQLGILREAVLADRALSEAEVNLLDLPEVLLAGTWIDQPNGGWTGREFILKPASNERHTYFAWFLQEADIGKPVVNVWATSNGDLVEYRQKLVKDDRGDRGYTIMLDAKGMWR